MEKYIFKKSKGKYIWQSPELKLVFSDMTFQAHDDYGYVSSTEDFLYLYYTVEIYVLHRDYDKNGKTTRHWKLVTAKSTYDFPSITILQWILQQYVNNKIPEEDCGVIHYYDDGEIREDRIGYVYSMDTDSWFCEDYYQVERLIIKEHDKEIGREYSLYAGSSIDFHGGSPSIGVKATISESGIQCLLTCVTEFLNDGIDDHNKAIREFLSDETYSVDTAGRIVKTENGKVTEMFLKNDIVSSIYVYCGDLNSDSFYSDTYHHVKISDITKNGITITGGYCERLSKDYNEEDVENRKLFVSCKNIFHIFSDITEQVLALDEQGIADEFRTVLTQEELAEMKNSDVEEMYQKWYEVIVDRYIIFRDEHPFRKIKKDDRKNAMEAVRTVIKILGE